MKKALLLVPSLLLLASCTITGPLPGQSVTPAPSQSAEPTPSQSGSVTPSQSTSGTSTSVGPSTVLDTIDFTSTDSRTVCTSSQVVYVGANGATFTNDKASSTVSFDSKYYNPHRAYGGSTVTISFSSNFTAIDIDCVHTQGEVDVTKFYTNLKNSSWSSGSLTEVSTGVFCWTGESTNSVTLTCEGQCRFMHISIR